MLNSSCAENVEQWGISNEESPLTNTGFKIPKMKTLQIISHCFKIPKTKALQIIKHCFKIPKMGTMQIINSNKQKIKSAFFYCIF